MTLAECRGVARELARSAGGSAAPVASGEARAQETRFARYQRPYNPVFHFVRRFKYGVPGTALRTYTYDGYFDKA